MYEITFKVKDGYDWKKKQGLQNTTLTIFFHSDVSIVT